MGVYNQGAKINSYSIEKSLDDKRWLYDEKFIEFKGNRINFSNNSLIAQLQLDSETQKALIRQIIKESVEFVKAQKEYVLSHVSKQTLND